MAKTENPRLLKRLVDDGKKYSLYLEYYLGRTATPKVDADGNQMYYTDGKMAGKPMYSISHHRSKETLELYLIAKPRTEAEKAQNKATLELAKQIRTERDAEMLKNKQGYRVERKKDNSNFVALFQEYIDKYTKGDKRVVEQALNRFKAYLREDSAKNKNSKNCKVKIQKDENGKEVDASQYLLNADMLTKEMVLGYVDYLKAHSEGSGASSTYRRFCKVVRAFEQTGYIVVNPCKELTAEQKPAKDDGETLRKEILTEDEIQALFSAHCRGENPDVRRAFITSLYTGIRWCDIVRLKYSNIDRATNTLIFDQAKTKGHSSHSRVKMPLRDDLLVLLGDGEPDELIFKLPSHTMALKALRHWTKRAGIDKHITWHCARHTFATLLLANNTDLGTTKDLLGHSSFAYLPVYSHAVEEIKRDAVNKMKPINLN